MIAALPLNIAFDPPQQNDASSPVSGICDPSLEIIIFIVATNESGKGGQRVPRLFQAWRHVRKDDEGSDRHVRRAWLRPG